MSFIFNQVLVRSCQ